MPTVEHNARTFEKMPHGALGNLASETLHNLTDI